MSALIDIGVGLAVIFLIFSIIVSGINEWFAQAFARRGYYLRLGMQRLINDDAVYRRVMNHPLIASLYRSASSRGKPPSYVEPTNFALALADVLHVRASSGNNQATAAKALTLGDLRKALGSSKLADSPLQAALLPIVNRAGDDLEAALTGIEHWFAGAMDRVSGWYKARTQKMIFLIGLALAAAANVDALAIFASLNESPAMRQRLYEAGLAVRDTGTVNGIPMAALQDRPPTESEWTALMPVLESLRQEASPPIGYACLGRTLRPASNDGEAPRSPAGAGAEGDCASSLAAFWQQPIHVRMLKLLGWILTALAGTLGATYWFGLLTRLIDLRGAGSRPASAESSAGK